MAERERNAESDFKSQSEQHRGFSENIGEELTAKWETEVRKWENAPWPKDKVENPYEMEEECE